MFKFLRLFTLFTLSAFLMLGCEDPANDDENDPVDQTHTEDINVAPQFLDLESAVFSTIDYDLSFESGQMSYVIKMNVSAGVLALASDTIDFATDRLPALGYATDGGDLVIGDTWMDISTYNPADHSIGGNNMVYFIRTADYHWVKMRVLAGTTSSFSIEYALYDENSGYGTTQSATISYSTGAPGLFSFGQQSTIPATVWDLALATTPEYSDELETNFYMPTILLNAATKVAMVENTTFDELTTVPDGLTWIQDSGSDHPFGNAGAHQVLVYHPEPPYNHKVIVEHPEIIYIVETAETTFKLQFDDYSSGIVLFKFDTL